MTTTDDRQGLPPARPVETVGPHLIDRLVVRRHPRVDVRALLLSASAAHATSRVKDIAGFEGVRENMLVGYGLVVGLQNTGDDLLKIGATKESLLGMLERLGVNTRDDVLDTANVAAVLVTATMPPFSRNGNRIDITVSSLGNAKSLNGGALAVTPLMGADGEVYAVAQGDVQTGSFTAQGAGASITRGVPTSGRIANGGIVEREVDFTEQLASHEHHQDRAAQSRLHHRAPHRRCGQRLPGHTLRRSDRSRHRR